MSFMCSAHEMSLPVRTSVRDIAAGGEHSLLLTTSGQVFFVGFSLATQKPTMMRLNLPVHSPAHSVQFVAQRIWASGSLSCCYSSVQVILLSLQVQLASMSPESPTRISRIPSNNSIRISKDLSRIPSHLLVALPIFECLRSL